MNCPEARDWLLQAEDPRRCARPGVADHVRECAGCQSLVAQLAGLEQAYRSLPAPQECDAARAAFLRRLPARRTTSRRATWTRWAVAAVLLLGVGVAAWTLLPAPQAYAAPVLIEQLVDLNLKLAEAASLDERTRLLAHQHATFQSALDHGQLPHEDRALMTQLLEHSTWLAANDDPVGKAERFAVVADQLVARAQSAAERKDQKNVDRYIQLQSKVAERGVSASLARAEETGVLNFENEKRIEKVVLRDSKRMKTLIDLMERDPDLSRREIRLALDLPMKPTPGPSTLVFEVHARDNPVRVGVPTAYSVTLLNQGPGLGKGHLLVALPEGVEFISARGPSNLRRDASGILLAPVQLAPRAELRYEIQVMPRQAGEGKCHVELRGKQLGARPLWREQKSTIVADHH